MPTTSNFGWTTPADTDLVKDGAAAIRTLGSGIDTSLVDLKGGTTGQVLSKNSNTDLDYTWVTPNVGDITEVQAGTGISVASGTGPIPVVTNTVATAYDAKGDLIVGTGADTFAKLTVGTNGHTLVADSSTSTGLKWAAGSSPSYTWTSYTPTWTNLTVGNATVVARYLQVDKLMTVYVKLKFGSTTSISSAVVQFSVPSATTSDWQYNPIFVWQATDSGNNTYVGNAYFEGSNTNVGFYIWKADATYISTSTNAITSTVPFTWGTNDEISISFTYEVA